MTAEASKVLVTGASGFVGNALMHALGQQACINPIGAVRRPSPGLLNAYETELVGDMNGMTDWSSALVDVQVIIHTAGRAHMMKADELDRFSELRKENVDGTLFLAQQAIKAGVKRFIFISSIKVNGERTAIERPFSAEDEPAPEECYGHLKLEAEQGLQKLAAGTSMEVVIIRPPLVYGAGVKGNFLRMIHLVEKGIPLPFGDIHNKRSFVALDNLVDLIVTCIDHPAAANKIFLAGDGEDLSTTALLRRLAAAMDKPSRLLPVPEELLRFGAKLLGRKELANRLFGSLQVDITKTREILGWEPQISVEEGLKRCFEKAGGL